MAEKINIEIDGKTYAAELNQSATACAIRDLLPLEGRANLWGAEIYFPIPVKCELEQDSRDVLEAGEIAYWPVGSAFCIFFGPTAISHAGEIRAASPVNVIGRIKSDLASLWEVEDQQLIRVVKSQ